MQDDLCTRLYALMHSKKIVYWHGHGCGVGSSGAKAIQHCFPKQIRPYAVWRVLHLICNPGDRASPNNCCRAPQRGCWNEIPASCAGNDPVFPKVALSTTQTGKKAVRTRTRRGTNRPSKQGLPVAFVGAALHAPLWTPMEGTACGRPGR